MRRRIVYLIGLSFVLSTLSCGEDDPLDQAWQKFRDGDYAGAHAAFTNLIPGEREAYVGLGFTTMRMDSIDEASGYFSVVAADSFVAAYAGWCVTAWERNEDAQGVERGLFVLREQPVFVFTHERTLTDDDVRWHIAACYLNLGNYQACSNMIQTIDASFVSTTNPDLLLAKLEALYDTLD